MATTEVVFKSCRQGGERYKNILDNESGIMFDWVFNENAMYAKNIWEQTNNKFKHMDLNALFGNENPVCLEIGCGNGEFLKFSAENNKNYNWLGFEVFHKMFVKTVNRCKNFDNIRLFQFDAEFFIRLLPNCSINSFFINFPDPWPKERHHKRRLLKPWFLELLSSKLEPGQTITVVTDHKDYAMELVENFSSVTCLKSVYDTPYTNDMRGYYKTKYYRKFCTDGDVYFFKYLRHK